ncbi:hypothetical protein D3C81_1410140 [compost metagenome]
MAPGVVDLLEVIAIQEQQGGIHLCRSVIHQRRDTAAECGAVRQPGERIVHRGAHQLCVPGLQLELPLLHFVEQTVEILPKAMELFDTLLFDAAREITVRFNVMHHVGDILQCGDDSVVQRTGNGQRHKSGEKNTASQHGKRRPEEMANQAVARGNAHFTNHLAVMHHGLCGRDGEQHATDQRAQGIGIIIRGPRPVGKTLLMDVEHLGNGKLPLSTQCGKRFISGGGIIKY